MALLPLCHQYFKEPFPPLYHAPPPLRLSGRPATPAHAFMVRYFYHYQYHFHTPLSIPQPVSLHSSPRQLTALLHPTPHPPGRPLLTAPPLLTPHTPLSARHGSQHYTTLSGPLALYISIGNNTFHKALHSFTFTFLAIYFIIYVLAIPFRRFSHFHLEYLLLLRVTAQLQSASRVIVF